MLANLFMHYAFDGWMAREFPGCPFERYADDAVVHCSSEGRARQVLAALEEPMRQAGPELHPGKTRIVYCTDGKRGRFTGFSPAASDKAVKRMSEMVASWHLNRHVNLTWEELVQWIGPVIRGWMSYYGRFYRSRLYPLLARINYHVGECLRAKCRRLRPRKALRRAWDRATTQQPRALPHWQWVTAVHR